MSRRLFHLHFLAGYVVNRTIEEDINLVVTDELDCLVLDAGTSFDTGCITTLHIEAVDCSRFAIAEAIIVDPDECYAVVTGRNVNLSVLTCEDLGCYKSSTAIQCHPACRQVLSRQTFRSNTSGQLNISRNTLDRLFREYKET